MNVSKKAKQLATVLMSAICMLSLILGTGCTDTPAIEDYPEAITQNSKPDDNTDVKKPDESNDADANIDAVFLDDFDSLKESGEFVYNPTTLHPVLKHEVESNPKIAKIAKKILESVYNVEEEITFSDELECNNSEFNQALILAQFSSPMVSATVIDFKEDNTYTITYFPTYQFSNDESYMVEIADSLSPEDAKIRFDEYEKIITEGINNNLSSKDDSIERAAKIYKYIIENFEIDNGGTVEDEDPEDNYLRSINNSIVDEVVSGKLKKFNFLELYSYYLVQLNVDNIFVADSALYYGTAYPSQTNVVNADDKPLLTFWTIITDGDKSYNCALLEEKNSFDEKRLTDEDCEADMLYFGMSDETRDTYFQNADPTVIQNINPMSKQKVPRCEEDYKFAQ